MENNKLIFINSIYYFNKIGWYYYLNKITFIKIKKKKLFGYSLLLLCISYYFLFYS